MKALALFLLAGIIMAGGCASSEKNDAHKKGYVNLVEVRAPEQQNHEDSKVYIDSVQFIDDNNRRVLLISGNFPDGCTHLGQASHTTHTGKVELSLSAWRDPDMMCTQALTPFSFIYDDLTKEDFKQQSTLLVNGTTYELK